MALPLPDFRMHLKRSMLVPILVGSLVLPSLAAAQGTASDPAAREVAQQTTVLTPGDVVRLRIWREPDLSGDFQVDEHGTAVFPKIGPMQILSITPDSLKKVLVATYAQYLRDPAIEVTFLRRVSVLGAVKNPGLYPVDPTMNVQDAVALAGGPLPNGRPRQFEVRRDGQKITVDFSSETPIGRTAIRSGDEIFVPEKSWFARNGALVVGASITAAAIIASAFIRY